MKLEKQTERWVEAKLIERGQAEAILRFEKEQASGSWVLYTISGLGVVVLLCGFVSIFAANWYAIPASSKLTLYFVSLGLLGWAASRLHERPGVVRESVLTAFGLYVLAGIGLIGQSYNLEGDGYQALLLWLALILPITLNTRSRLLNTIWVLGLGLTACIWVFSVSPDHHRIYPAVALPYLLLACGYAGRRLLPAPFCDALRFWSYITLLVPFAIIGNIGWAAGDIAFASAGSDYILVPFLAAALAAISVIFRDFQRGALYTASMLVTIGASIALFLTPLTTRMEEHPILGCALFVLLWCGGATLAASVGRKRLFDFAAFVVGARFIVVYFEVFGSLAATGAGLILSGAVILGIAYLWHRYRGRLAKTIQENA